MKVIASKGLRCPMEDNPRKYITDSEPVEVIPTAYYKRLIMDGSLIEIKEETKTKNKKKEE